MFANWMGTVGLALLLLVTVLAMLRVVRYALREPAHLAPHEVADALGRLADAERVPFIGKMPTLTDRERQEAKARLYLVSQKARGRTRIATFPGPPRDVA